jgi:hypothetical protein
MYLAFRMMLLGMPRLLQRASIAPVVDCCDSAGNARGGDSADAGVLARVPFRNAVVGKFISKGLLIPNNSKCPELPLLARGDRSGVQDE